METSNKKIVANVFSSAVLLFLLLTGCKEKPAEKAELHSEVPSFEEQYKNHSRAIYIRPDWIRDPYIYLASDGYYYLTGTTAQPDDPREMTDVYNTGLDNAKITGQGQASIVGYSIRVWKSKNLKDWEYTGEPFTLSNSYWQEQFPEAFDTIPKKDWRLWAPELYLENEKWIFVHTTPAPVPSGANLAITTGSNLKTGSFTYPMGDDMRRKHDPSLFKDDDGIWYLLWGNTYIAPLKPGFSGLAKDPVRIDPENRIIGHEGATLRKIGDKYVHFGTAWSTDNMRKGSYNLYYATADSVRGPYGPRRFAGRFLGHGTPFKDKEGRWWCTAFYNANEDPLSDEGIQTRDLSETALTINEQGTTIVPLEVKIQEDGDLFIRAKDPRYRNPGPDEKQTFELR